MSQQDRLPVGVVGVGRLGGFHTEKYASLPEVELKGVVDLDEERANAVGRRWGVPAFTDYRKLIPLVKAVTVAVPTSLHFKLARDFLRAGIHVLVEKPVTTSLSDLDELITLAAKQRLILMPGHVERFNSALAAVKKIIDKPRFIEAHRLNSFTPRGTDVDVVLDLMIHDLDIILSLVPAPVEEVYSVGVPVLSTEVDIANARLHLAGQCVANLTASRVSREVMRKIRIFQKDTYISIDYAGHKVEIVRRAWEEGEPSLSGESLDLKGDDALLSEVKAFTASIRSGGEPPVTASQARAALSVALTILSRMQRGDGSDIKSS